MENKKHGLVTDINNFIFSSDSSSYNLNFAEKCLLICLARYSGKKGIFPSVITIADNLQCGPKYARNLIKSLEKKNLIQRKYRAGKSCFYSLINYIPTPPLQGSTPLPYRGAYKYNN